MGESRGVQSIELEFLDGKCGGVWNFKNQKCFLSNTKFQMKRGFQILQMNEFFAAYYLSLKLISVSKIFGRWMIVVSQKN